MQSGIERRKTTRVRGEGSVDCQPYALLLPVLEERVIHGDVVDVSIDGHGLGFVTARPVFTGRRLRLESLGGARAAVVRWVAAAPQGYRVGISIGDAPGAPALG